MPTKELRGDARPRPPRQTIRIAVKREVVKRQGGICPCGCGQAVSEKPKTNTHFDHRPPLRLRDINEAGNDYIPPQQDPKYIDAVCPDEHHSRTRGTGATTAGTDIGNIKKERKREKLRAGAPQKPRKKIQSPGFRRDLTRGFDGKVRRR